MVIEPGVSSSCNTLLESTTRGWLKSMSSGRQGLVPTAMMKWSAVNRSVVPSALVTSTVCSSTNEA